MAGLRDVLIHGYEKVDMQLIWEITVQSLPGLIAQIARLVRDDPT